MHVHLNVKLHFRLLCVLLYAHCSFMCALFPVPTCSLIEWFHEYCMPTNLMEHKQCFLKNYIFLEVNKFPPILNQKFHYRVVCWWLSNSITFFIKAHHCSYAVPLAFSMYRCSLFFTRHMIISSKLWLRLKFLSFFRQYGYSSVYFISPCVLRVPCHLITLIILILDTICEAYHCARNIGRTPVSKYHTNILLILNGN